MFASVFILVAAQMFDLLFGSPFAVMLGETRLMFSGEEVSPDSNVFDVTAGAVRTIYGPFILLISLIFSLSLLVKRTAFFKNSYLVIISFLSAFSIFISATRGWIIGVLCIFIGFALVNTKKFGKIAIVAIVLFFIALTIPKINLQIIQSLKRTLTLESFVKGDLTAEGTLSRITERSPVVMNKFYEKPILGFGFSSEYYKYADGHVGNQTLLLNGGVVGFIIFFVFTIYLMKRYIKGYINQKNHTAFILLFGLISMIIIHSTTAMIFGYALQVGTAIFLAIFFFFSDYFLKYSQNELKEKS